MTDPGVQSIIIVGAGPSGLLLALLLAQLDPRPSITILDAAPTLNTAPRATHYGPPAIRYLRKAGILPQVRQQGYLPKTICWRKLNGTRIAGFDRALLHDDGIEGNATTVLPCGQLCELVAGELKGKGVRVAWGWRVSAIESGLEDDATSAAVTAEKDGETKTFEADFVVGCDGGNSTIRRLMFGPRNFPGFSWEEQVVATNTRIDLDRFGWEDTNNIIDNEHWFMAARIIPSTEAGKNDIWRISYGELPGLSTEELMERLPMKFEAMLPGHPRPGSYEVLNKAPYRVHQRIADTMRKGRVLLAADAAHLCNPFGGLGLTGGIVDVGSLSECLGALHQNLADEEILTTWAETRRQRYNDIINPWSQANIRRMFAQDPETALQDDWFLQAAERAETDLEFSKEFQNASNALLCDYTQHFRKPEGSASAGLNVKRGVEGRPREDSAVVAPV